MKERAVLFGQGTELVGILTETEKCDPNLPAFVFFNAGVTHRIGPSRMYVRLARELAEAGHYAMRFDFSGLGDSSRRTDDMPVGDSVIREGQDAMDLLERTYGVKRFVLIGLCSGATISYLCCKQDPRVMGVVLINAQSHLHGLNPDLGEHLRDKTVAAHSWRIALKSSFRKKNIRKAIGGQLNPIRIARMMIGMPMALLFRGREQGDQAKAYDSAADLRAVTERGIKLFHLYSEGDEGLDYLSVVLSAKERAECNQGNSKFELVPKANHVFTLLWSQDVLVESVLKWAREEAR